MIIIKLLFCILIVYLSVKRINHLLIAENHRHEKEITTIKNEEVFYEFKRDSDF